MPNIYTLHFWWVFGGERVLILACLACSKHHLVFGAREGVPSHN